MLLLWGLALRIYKPYNGLSMFFFLTAYNTTTTKGKNKTILMAEIPHGRPAKTKSLHRLTNQLVMAPHSINSRLVNSKNHCSCFLDIKVAYDASQKTSFNMHSPHLVTVD